MRHFRNRYWTRCVDGRYGILYRLRFPGAKFELLLDQHWVDRMDRYKRVAWGSDYDEIDELLAESIETAIKLKCLLLCE